jgi:hypothetical protein
MIRITSNVRKNSPVSTNKFVLVDLLHSVVQTRIAPDAFQQINRQHVTTINTQTINLHSKAVLLVPPHSIPFIFTSTSLTTPSISLDINKLLPVWTTFELRQ